MTDEKQKPLSRAGKITGSLFALENRKQVAGYCYAILTLLTVSIFGIFVIAPAFSTISNLQKKLEDSRQVHKALQTKLAAIQSLDAQYQKLKDDLNLVYQAIPTSSQIPLLTRQIETLCQQNNTTLNSFTVQSIDYFPLQEGKQFYSYTFSVDVEGQQGSINDLIASIVSFNRLVSISSISTGKTHDGLIGMTLSGKAYFAEK